jgi:transcriptional regulator with XRE-family HTH domain
MNYGKALRIARAVSGLQQQELAERAGLNASHISLIEKGSRKPSVGAIEKLSKALEMPESLFTMLAAESGDVKGISEAELEGVGRYLARFVIHNAGTETAKRKRSVGRKRTRDA